MESKTEMISKDRNACETKANADPVENLMQMVPGLTKDHTSGELKDFRERALQEAGSFSPVVAALVELFFQAAICSAEDREHKKDRQSSPMTEPTLAAKSDKITPRHDDFISLTPEMQDVVSAGCVQ
jgi:hypothetical protein